MVNGVKGKRCEGHRWALEVIQALAGDRESEHKGGQ